MSASRCLPAAWIFSRSGTNARPARVRRLLLQHLAVADDGVEGRPQLVAHVGQEVALGAARLLWALSRATMSASSRRWIWRSMLLKASMRPPQLVLAVFDRAYGKVLRAPRPGRATFARCRMGSETSRCSRDESNDGHHPRPEHDEEGGPHVVPEAIAQLAGYRRRCIRSPRARLPRRPAATARGGRAGMPSRPPRRTGGGGGPSWSPRA